MPYRIHVVKTNDFIKLDGQGHLDVNKSHDVLARLAKSCVEQGVNCALLDVRDVTSSLKLTELLTLAKAFPEMGFRDKHRLAVLHRYGGGERAELFAMFASDRGWNVHAFDDYEEAIAWFGSEFPIDQPAARNDVS